MTQAMTELSVDGTGLLILAQADAPANAVSDAPSAADAPHADAPAADVQADDGHGTAGEDGHAAAAGEEQGAVTGDAGAVHSMDVQSEVGHLDEAHETHDTHGGIPLELWLLVALIIVIAAAWKPMKRAMLTGLDNRAARIRNELEEAQRLREEAQSLLATMQRQQRDALQDAEEIISHARQDAERLRAQAAAELEVTLKRREQLAMERIGQAESAALAEVRSLAVDVAATAARAVLETSVDEQRGSALIDESIAALDGRLH